MARDASGLGNHAGALNGPVWGAGRVGGALSFDGVNDVVRDASTTFDGTGYGTPWIAVCLDQEPAYDLLVMKSNVHNFNDAETFFRLSELNEVLKGFMEALKLVQQRIVDEASAGRAAVVQDGVGRGG